MLSVTPISVAQAGTYYQKDGGYYDAERPGEWDGKAAEALGLRGEVKPEEWQRVIRGQHPRTGEQLVQIGTNGKHRAATDNTFSMPKSASAAALIAGRDEIFYAQRDAVDVALKYQEKDAARVRVTQNGKRVNVRTENLLFAKYEQTLSRENDCQIHTHCPALNFSQLPDGSWKALSNELFFKNKLFYGQIYRNELAANLKQLGYQIEPGKDGLFEIAGVDKSVRDAFSRRSEQIKAAMEKLREKYPTLNESRLREYATLGSRVAKEKNIDIDAIRASWGERLAELGITREDLNRQIDEAMVRPDLVKEPMSAHEAIRTAGKVITEQESSFPREELLRIAGQFSLGLARIHDLEQAKRDLTRAGEIVRHKDGSFTTREMKQIEAETVQMMVDGHGKAQPVMTREEALAALAGRRLTESQSDLITHVLTSKDRVIGGMGPPGVGKTTALDALRDILSSQGRTIKGIAYTGKAADGIEQEAGIKSSTIAKDSHGSTRTDWIVVDEASMTGSRDMHGILKRAREEGSSVLLLGDPNQLQSIGAGRIFKDMKDHGMSTVEMKQIIRQKDGTYKDIVQSLVAKRIDDAFVKLTETGRIHEIADSTERLSAIAKDYTGREGWRDAVVLTSKNVDARSLNSMISAILKDRGEIGQRDIEMTVRTPVSLSPTEQRFGQSYEEGQYVFAREAGVAGLRAGDEARVVAVDRARHTVMIETKSRAKRLIDLIKDGGRLSLYEERRDKFSEREKVVFTKNDSKLKVRNGQMGEILKIDDRGTLIVAMQDGSTRHVDPVKNPYISHADAITTYKAQGISQDYVIVNAPADAMQTYNAMYVQATRGKYDLKVYTDRVEDLIERVKVEEEKTSTLDKSIDQDHERSINDEDTEKARDKDVGNEEIKEPSNEPQAREIASDDVQALYQDEGRERSEDDGQTNQKERELER